MVIIKEDREDWKEERPLFKTKSMYKSKWQTHKLARVE